ncbi:hypothetical protein SAMN05660657_03063 [Geodermatophilus amargosae]|uniref:Uncharacterized protein n=1 Tax=Geodermatophilus amargosae TaxID=1296565 RepID=A0A1I7AVI7_9ACTN|nr:hypothetical protein SAMN05660657_03063 [Geodermatophilus amargosae]
MTNHQPVEPSAILDRDGASVPYRRAAAGIAPRLRPPLLPTLALVATAGPVLTASAFALTAVAAAKAVEMAGRMAWQVPRSLVGGHNGPQVVPGGLEVTWIRVELRWPS